MTEPDSEILARAVELAFHRVTGDDIVRKTRRRTELHNMMSALRLGRIPQPTAAEIRQAIGETDDKLVLAALKRRTETDKILEA